LLYQQRSAVPDVGVDLYDWVRETSQTLQAHGHNLTCHTIAGLGSRRTFDVELWNRRVALFDRAARAGTASELAVMAFAADGEPLFLASLSSFSQVITTGLMLVHRADVPVTPRDFIDWCRGLAPKAGSGQGILATTGLPPEYRFWGTPEERRLGWFGPNALRKYAGGIGWAMWLPQELVSQLGGLQRAEAPAPYHRIERLAGGLWLELTTDPLETLEEDRLDAAHAFVQPIMPTQRDLQLADPPAIRPARPRTGRKDDYHQYSGPPVPVVTSEVRHTEDIAFHLDVEPALDPRQRAALERAVYRWHQRWSDPRRKFPVHDLSALEVGDQGASWAVDFGGAPAVQPIEDLARRLAGWAEHWNVDPNGLYLNPES
jgi:hypothetical protein